MIIMKKILYTVSALLLLAVTDVCAQQVRTEGNYVVIDCTTMPAKARRMAAYTGAAAQAHNERDTWNRVAYNRFAVSKTDVKADGTAGTATAINWATATAACSAYAGPAGGEVGQWRLPTQRELMLCWTMKKALEAQSGFTAWNTEFYWSSTENSDGTTFVWYVYFINGEMGSKSQTDRYHVRCVREF